MFIKFFIGYIKKILIILIFYKCYKFVLYEYKYYVKWINMCSIILYVYVFVKSCIVILVF